MSDSIIGSSRDHGSRDHNQIANYNRHRPQGGNRGHNNWSGSNWSSQGWNQQSFGGGSGSYGGNQNWGSQWKYGGGSGGGSASGQQGYGSGYSNWNYYGQYGQQNWNSQVSDNIKFLVSLFCCDNFINIL